MIFTTFSLIFTVALAQSYKLAWKTKRTIWQAFGSYTDNTQWFMYGTFEFDTIAKGDVP